MKPKAHFTYAGAVVHATERAAMDAAGAARQKLRGEGYQVRVYPRTVRAAQAEVTVWAVVARRENDPATCACGVCRFKRARQVVS